MAFLLSHDPLIAQRKLQARIAPGTRVLRAADVDAWAQAEGLIAAARAQAQAITDSAQAAYDEECRRGYAEGRAEAQMAQAEKMMETASRTIDYFSQVEADMVSLVMGAVRKIMDDYDDAERVLTVVRNALSVVRNQKQMTLRLHPQQVEVVRARVNHLLSAFPGVGYLDIVADARLGLHACIVESEIGLVEASIDGQITALERAFQKVLGSRI